MTLRARIIRELRAAPASAPDLALLCAPGKPNARQQVWVQLRELAAGGVIAGEFARSRLTEGRGSNQRVRVWRLTSGRAA